MAQWLMENNFQLIVGFDFHFKTKPKPAFNFDGIFHCKVLEIVPFKKLSYSWNGGSGDGEINLESVVTWRLEPKDKGTEVFLEHTGFDREENLGFYNGLNQGWIEKFEGIAKLLNAAQHDTNKA
jgi:uncharacterized protein YndB with AHSA1/START domain